VAPSVQAVGFDLDDTLAVTTRDRETLLRTATDRVGAPTITREAYLRAHADHSGADSRESIFAALLDGEDVDPPALAAAYRETVEAALEPVPGAESLVSGLRADYRVGLLTDGPVEAQMSKLRHLGWTDLFDAVVVTGALRAPKPDAAAFDALAEALDVPAGETAYVGDHPTYDVEGAADAGMTPVQVTADESIETHPDAAATVSRDRLAEEVPSIISGF